MVTALLMALLGLQVGVGPGAHAATNQFHGVNWADPNDNFVTGDITPVGLSTSDSYATTYAKATLILKGFQALGANTVRMGFNRATVSDNWWNSYTAAFDAASDLGMNVVLAPWLQNGVSLAAPPGPGDLRFLARLMQFPRVGVGGRSVPATPPRCPDARAARLPKWRPRGRAVPGSAHRSRR